MDAFAYASYILIAMGVTVRIATTRRFMTLYRARYDGYPPRSWMVRRIDDPEVARARLWPAIGTLMVLAGTLVILVQIMVQGPA